MKIENAKTFMTVTKFHKLSEVIYGQMVIGHKVSAIDTWTYERKIYSNFEVSTTYVTLTPTPSHKM